MAFKNKSWVGYHVRTASQILDLLLNDLRATVPEMTDLSPSNPYVRNLEQFADIYELLNYYVDNAAREAILVTARLYASGIYHARQNDYQVIGNLPYSTDVQFALDTPHTSIVTIPAGTLVTNSDQSIPYRTTAPATIQIGSLLSSSVTAIQSVIITGVDKGTAPGTADFVLTMTEKAAHDSVKVYINNLLWSSKETLALSGPLDRDYVQNVDTQGNIAILFGNSDPNGAIPGAGMSVRVDYDLTLGADGYVAQGEINTIPSTAGWLPVGKQVSVSNLFSASGGSNVESLASIQHRIPLINRTKRRAVTESDFRDIAELAPGVQTAGVKYDGRRYINVYIVPTGGGIASTGLIASTQQYIDARRVVGTAPVVKPAGELRIKLAVRLQVSPSYSRAAVIAAVEAALVEANSYTERQVGVPNQSSLHISDLYEIIEDVPGVLNSSITVFYLQPYARPVGNSPALNWTVSSVSTAVNTVRWQLVFLTGSTFRLIRNSTLIGTFTTGTTYSNSDIQFNVASGGHSNGDSYEFYSYPYNANDIMLSEPSIAIAEAADISLTATGGY